jgi:hypothetical protein
MTTTTDAKGSYSFSVPGVSTPRQLTGALLVVPRGEYCIDSATGLQQPLPLGAMIPAQAPGMFPTLQIFVRYDTAVHFCSVQQRPKWLLGNMLFTADLALLVSFYLDTLVSSYLDCIPGDRGAKGFQVSVAVHVVHTYCQVWSVVPPGLECTSPMYGRGIVKRKN